jgi:hypothetical protein
MLLLAILVSGFCAAVVVEQPMLALVTALLAWTIAVAARRAGERESMVVAVSLPEHVQQAVDHALAQLYDGDAERLLLEIVHQARPLYDTHESAFDARHNALTGENTSHLVVECCDVALQLAQVDELRSADILSARDAVQRAETRAKYDATRDMLARQLSDAASALAALYVSGVEHGTPASDRVAELVTEIKRDAAARSAAGAEMGTLLRDS